MEILKNKTILASLIIILSLAGRIEANPDPKQLNGVSPERAIEIANEWSQKRENVVSFVTPEAVVFRFPDKRIVKIPIKGNKMYVAIAPFIYRTHT